MARDTSDDTPIASTAELAARLAEGCKPSADWRIGTEHEKIAFRLADHAPVPYGGPQGIGALLTALGARCGWEPIVDQGHIIGLAEGDGGGAISIEPGGQFELSGAPVRTLHDTASELDAHLAAVGELADAFGLGFLALGASPLWTLAQTPVMPKSRYAIMADYMPTVGTRGLDMMFRSATVQVNLDFSSEADMATKMRVSLALQPLATALFANSPYLDGRPTGRLSERSEIWRDTDRNRTGMLPFAFEPGYGFERYVDWALDIPMYFVKRGLTYHRATHVTFRQFMAGALRAELPGVEPTLGDWDNHLGTLFPEVRLKRFLEMRGADMGGRDHVLALPAFWVGLLYDETALAAADDLIAGWTAEARQALRDAVPVQGLHAAIGGRKLVEVAREVLALSRAGLVRRARLGTDGRDESRYLDPLEPIAASGLSLAERKLAQFGKDVTRLFTEDRI